MSDIVLLRNDGQATLIIDNAQKRNCVDLKMLRLLAEHARTLTDDPEVRLVILRGAGHAAFSAGADFDSMTIAPIRQSVEEMDSALQQAVQALQAIQAPVLAAIEGACFGGAIQLALTADIRLATSRSQFGIPAAQLGIAYPLAAIADIVARAGMGAAQLMLLSGEPFGAQEAYDRRIVDEVVAAAQFEDRLKTLAASILACSAESARAYKRMIKALAADDVAEAGEAHLALRNAAAYLPKLAAILARRRAPRTR